MELYSLVKSYNFTTSSYFITKVLSAKIGEGSIIMNHALVKADVTIGINSIINSKALIKHYAIVENHCHISTAAIINGRVKIGKEYFIGSNSVTKENISIPELNFIKVSSLVIG